MKTKNQQGRISISRLRDKVLAFTLALCLLMPTLSTSVAAADTISAPGAAVVETSPSPAATGEPTSTPAGDTETSVPDAETPAPGASSESSAQPTSAVDTETSAPDEATSVPDASGESSAPPTPEGTPAEGTSAPTATSETIVPEDSTEPSSTPSEATPTPLSLKAAPRAVLDATTASFEYKKDGSAAGYVDTLREAIAAIEGSTSYQTTYIKVLKDTTVEGSSTVTDAAFTLNLNDKTLNHDMTIYLKGSKTIVINGGSGGTGKIYAPPTGTETVFSVADTAHMVLESGTIEGTYYGILVESNTTVEIKGGTITTGITAIYKSNSGSWTAKISGGTLKSKRWATVAMNDGKLYLSGKPTIENGGETAQISYYKAGNLIANDGKSFPTHYTGGQLVVDCGWTLADKDVLVSGVKDSTAAKSFFFTNPMGGMGGFEVILPSNYPGNITLKKAKALTRIDITRPPAKTAYTVGEKFDPTGMVVTASYSDGTSAVVTNYTTDVGTTPLQTYNQSITVSHTFESVTKEATQDITVERPFEVSFNLNGGSGSYKTQEIPRGGKATKPPTDPTQSGYIFEGWFNGVDLDPFDFNTPITENTYLTARWEQAEATWTINGGTFIDGSFIDGVAAMKEKATASSQPNVLRLLKSVDLSLSSSLSICENATTVYTLDLNGKTLNTNQSLSIGAGKVSIEGGSGGSGTISCSKARDPVLSVSDANLTLNNVGISSDYGSGIHCFYGTVLDITRGYIMTNSTTDRAIYISDSGNGCKVKISSGMILSQNVGIECFKIDTLEITGGTIDTKNEAVYISEYSNANTKVKISGGNFVSNASCPINIQKGTMYLSGNNVDFASAIGYDINLANAGSLIANNGEVLPSYYTDTRKIKVNCGWGTKAIDDILVSGVKDADAAASFTFSNTTDKFEAQLPGNYPGDITLKKAKALTQIDITTKPTKTVYKVGETFDPAGMVVTAYYDDSSSAPITGYTIVDGDKPLTADVRSIYVSYTLNAVEKQTFQTITVRSPFKVTFDADGGTGEYPDQTVYSSDKVAEPSEPKKPGYTFEGWFKGDDKVKFDFRTPIVENTALKAKWVDKTAPRELKIQYKSSTDSWYGFGSGSTLTQHFGGDISIRLSSVDEGTGVKSFTYKLTGGAVQTINATDGVATFTIPAPYLGSISEVVAVDNAGNKSASSSTSYFVIDNVVPGGTITVDTGDYKPGEWTGDDVTLTISGATSESGIKRYQYSTDNGKIWRHVTPSKITTATEHTPENVTEAKVSVSGDTDATYLFRAVSNSSLNSANTTGTSVRIDTILPEYKLSGNTTDYLLKDTITLTDIKVGGSGIKKVEVKKNSDSFTDITATYKNGYAVSASAAYTFKVTNGANTATTKTITYTKIDPTKPTVTIDSNGYTANTWTASDITLTVTKDVSHGKIQYKIGDEEWKDYTAAIVINTDCAATAYSFQAISGAGVESDVTTFIVKRDAVKPDFTLSGNTTAYLVKDTITLTDIKVGGSGIKKVEVKKNSESFIDITATYKDGYTVSASAAYTFKVTNGANTATEKTITYTKIDPTKPTVTINSNGYTANTWTASDITLTVTKDVNHGKIQYKIGDGEWEDYTAAIVINTDCAATTYSFKAISGAGVEGDVTTFIVKRDTVVPTGDITFNKNSVKETLSNITFKLFFNDTVDAVITSNDSLSGVEKTEYYKSNKILTVDEIKALEGKNWVNGTSLSLTPKDKEQFIIYVRITDHAGNQCLFGSDGSTFDTSDPVISGAIDGTTYYVTQKVTIADDNLDTITLNGATASSPITLDGNQSETYKIEVTDKATNSSTLTVTMKPISELSEKLGALAVDNVTSASEIVITAVKEQVAAISITNATEDEKAALQAITDRCDSLLKKVEATAKESKRITDAVNAYSVDEVTSADKVTIQKLKADAEKLLAGTNLTAEERKALGSIVTSTDKLLKKIDDTTKENTRITDAVKTYSEDKVTSADKAAIQKLKADAEKLLAGKNLTEDERKAIGSIVTSTDKLLKKIVDTAKENTRITDAVKTYSEDKVTSADKATIEQLKKDAEKLLAGTNLTEDERKAIGSIVTSTDKLLEKIGDTAKENTRIIDAVNAYSEDKVTSADKVTIQKLKADAEKLLAGTNLTAEERKALGSIVTSTDKLLEKIGDTAKENARITDAVKTYSEDKVTSADKATIQKIKTDAEKLLAGTNLTEDERKAIGSIVISTDKLLKKIDDTAKENTRITDAVKTYSEDKVTSADKATIQKLKADAEKLLAGTNLTAEERKVLGSIVTSTDKLLEKIGDTAKENTRITDAVKTYSEDKVNSANKATIQKLKADAEKLLAGTNLTAEERKALGSIVTSTDKLLKKIDDTAKENTRITDAVKVYSEDKVTSADKVTIQKLKADAEKLLAGTNLTDEERKALKTIVASTDTLVKKIDDTVTESKRIADAVNAYSKDQVTSADKATIQKLKADAEKLLAGTNLTDEERKALGSIVTSTDTLVQKINDTVTESKRITDAVNAYSEDKVTSADKATIQKLKADAEKLLAGTNLTEDERKALETIVASTDTLVQKINDTATEIKRIADAVKEYSEDQVTSTDKETIEQLKKDAEKLLEGTNLTEDERKALGSIVTSTDTLVKKIDDTVAESKRIADAVNAYSKDQVTSADKAAIDQLKKDAEKLLAGANLTDEERKDLSTVPDRTDSLTETIKTAEKASEPESYDEVKDINKDNVSLSNQAVLEKAKEDLETSLKDFGKNFTSEETASIKEKISQMDDALKTIENVEAAIKAIEQLPAPEAIKIENRDAVLAANKLYESLSTYEKSLVGKDSSEKLAKVSTALANYQLKDDPTGTKVEAVGDTTFDPNIELVVVTSTSNEEQEKSVEAIAKGNKIVSLFDISLLLDGEKVQPNGMVRITLTISEGQLKSFTDFKVVSIDDSGVAKIIPSTVEGNKIYFETDHFSNYGIIGKPIVKPSPTPSDKPSTTPSANPATGDSSTTLPFIILLGASGCAILLLASKKRSHGRHRK